MFSKTLTLASLLTTALAVPAVTIKELPAACTSYPQYNAETSEAGPWSISAVNSDNAAIENAGARAVYIVSNSETGPVLKSGYIAVNDRVDLARNAFKCAADKLQIYTRTALDSDGEPINTEFTDVVLSASESDAQLLYLADGEQPSIYEHYVGEEKQAGVFIGGYNTTTWGVKWSDPVEGSAGLPFYALRLLPEGVELKVNETKTFLKVQA